MANSAIDAARAIEITVRRATAPSADFMVLLWVRVGVGVIYECSPEAVNGLWMIKVAKMSVVFLNQLFGAVCALAFHCTHVQSCRDAAFQEILLKRSSRRSHDAKHRKLQMRKQICWSVRGVHVSRNVFDGEVLVVNNTRVFHVRTREDDCGQVGSVAIKQFFERKI